MRIAKNTKTKVEQLIETIQNEIAAGVYKVGDALPSINSLSKSCDVSRDTVFKALNTLKEKGVLNSIHGKNYHVASASHDVLLLLGEYSPFKEIFYKSFREHLPLSYKVDLVFHQYNESFFNSIIQDAQGKFKRYIVMNYQNEKFPEALKLLDPEKVLLLDFGNFDKGNYSYVCQDFDQNFYKVLKECATDILKYKKLVYVLDSRQQHPQSSRHYFIQFCKDYELPYEIVDGIYKQDEIEEGSCYILVRQNDLVEIVRKGIKSSLKVGSDYGIIAYNEVHLYEILCNGITSFSVDWDEMGRLASEFVLKDVKIQRILPTLTYKRNSL